MLIVISPAKTLDLNAQSATSQFTIPDFLKDSEILIKELRRKTPENLSELMGISNNLAELNFMRNRAWQKNFTPENAKQALVAFRGEVFRGIDVDSLTTNELERSQNYLRILSGLYGLLRPLDLIQAYRLEMGTKLQTKMGDNLYQFWGNKITEKLNSTLLELNKKTLINLASNEYFKSVKTSGIKTKIITPIFKEEKNGNYQTIAVLAKKARGLMTRFIIQNELTNPNDLKAFDVESYTFNQAMSNENEFVFIR